MEWEQGRVPCEGTDWSPGLSRLTSHASSCCANCKLQGRLAEMRCTCDAEESGIGFCGACDAVMKGMKWEERGADVSFDYYCRNEAQLRCSSESMTEADGGWSTVGSDKTEVGHIEQISWKSLVTKSMHQGLGDHTCSPGLNLLEGAQTKDGDSFRCFEHEEGRSGRQRHYKQSKPTQKYGCRQHAPKQAHGKDGFAIPKGPLWVKSTMTATADGRSRQSSSSKHANSMHHSKSPRNIFASSVSVASSQPYHRSSTLLEKASSKRSGDLNLFYNVSASGGDPPWLNSSIESQNVGRAWVRAPSGTFFLNGPPESTMSTIDYESTHSTEGVYFKQREIGTKSVLKEGIPGKIPDQGREVKCTGWQKVWGKVAPQCCRPDVPPPASSSSGSSRMTSVEVMENIRKSKAQHEEDAISALSSVKRYSRRQKFLTDKIERSIL